MLPEIGCFQHSTTITSCNILECNYPAEEMDGNDTNLSNELDSVRVFTGSAALKVIPAC
jgi:hypothetical protein